MKLKSIVTAVLSVGVLASVPAFAQTYPAHQQDPWDRHARVATVPVDNRAYDPRINPQYDPRVNPKYDPRVENRPYNDRFDSRYDRREHRRFERRMNRYERNHFDMHRGYGPRGDWYQGGRMDRRYFAPRYIINDWQRYQLDAPPRGYSWVRVNNEFFLANLATDIIMNIIRR